MRNNLKNVQYLLFVLFMFALTGCGASNLAGTSSSDPGNITAKVVFDDGKSTAKSVGLIPPGVTAVRFKVTGPYTDPVAKTRYTTTKATFPGAAGGGTVAVSPGTGLIVTVQALGEGDALLYEGFARNVVVTSGATTNLGTITLTAPFVKTAEVPCLGCHEDSRAADGNNLVAEYKGSNHYRKTVSPSPSFNGLVYADSVGCAGCHTQNHKDLNPAVSGRCYDCHTAAGNPPNFPHATAGFVNLKNLCNECHNPHTTALLAPTTAMAGCINCHSVGQNAGTNYVQDNNGVRAITGEFQKWSHHVTGVNHNDAHCVACHLEGSVVNGKTVIDSTKHMANATTRLRNADTDAEFVWNPAAPSHTTMDNFCLSCHDADGATSPVSLQLQAFINTNKLTAAGKTASPINPFGDTISNQYDMEQRPAVVDAKGQFATGNNSHHAVLGKKYTGRTRSATPGARTVDTVAFASNSSAAMPGARKTIYDAGRFNVTYTTLADAAGETDVAQSLNGRNGGTTLGDDSTLHCGDCHTVGQFRAADVNTAAASFNKAVIGAHGSNNEYLLRNNAGTDERHTASVDPTTGLAVAAPSTFQNGTKPWLVCFNCHKVDNYGSTVNHAGESISNLSRCNGPGNTTSSFAGYTGERRLETRNPVTGVPYGTNIMYANMFGIQCANCHNSGVKGNLFGGIHGSKQQTYTDGNGNTTKHARFMPGLGNVMYAPGMKGGYVGGTQAIYKVYSGNRNGTIKAGFQNRSTTIGQTYTQLPVRNKVYPGQKNGSYEYTTGGVSNDLNWEQWKTQSIAGETDRTSSAMGCYTLSPNPKTLTGTDARWVTAMSANVAAGRGSNWMPAINMDPRVPTVARPTGMQAEPKVANLMANGYPADDIRYGAAYMLTAQDGHEVFDTWGGCDDHNGAPGGSPDAPTRAVNRKLSY